MHVDRDARHISAPAEGAGALTRIAARLDAAGIELDDIGLQRPSLDDVFLSLTGHEPRQPSRRRPTTSRSRRRSDDLDHGHPLSRPPTPTSAGPPAPGRSGR